MSQKEETYYHRACEFCRIKWIAKSSQRDCPKCHVDSFFTMNMDGMGTAMYMDAAGLTADDFEEVDIGNDPSVFDSTNIASPNFKPGAFERLQALLSDLEPDD